MSSPRPSMLPEIPEYTVLSVIGRGSMGVVYAARREGEERTVALKILHADVMDAAMAYERFQREVRAAAKIGHRGIPKVYDSGQLPDGRLFLAMDLLEGSDLEEWWEEPGRTRLQALELIASAMEPLAAAHATGIIHRDLKPENVFVVAKGDPPTRLLDFGIALDLDEQQKLRTATGIALGTPVYMSPEQATRPSEAGPATDVWSMGVMMYETMCGELPFDGESPHAVVVLVCTVPPVPLEHRSPDAHPDLVALVNQCLSKTPADRPQDGGALLARLRALLADPAVRATLGGPAATPDLRPSMPIVRADSSSSTRAEPTFVPVPERTFGDRTERTEVIADAPEGRPGGRLVLAAAAVLLFASFAGAAWWARPEVETVPPQVGASPASTAFAPSETSDPIPAMAPEPEATLGEPEPELSVIPSIAEPAVERRAPQRPNMRAPAVAEVVEPPATLEASPMEVVPTNPFAPGAPDIVALPQPDPPPNTPGTVVAPPPRPQPDPTPQRPASMEPVRTRPATMTVTPMRPVERPAERPGFVTF